MPEEIAEDVVVKDDPTAVVLIPEGGSNSDALIVDFSSGNLELVPYEGDADIAGILANSRTVRDISGFQFRYCAKGSLDYVSLNIGNADDYTEWTYETACGVKVSLFQSAYKSLKRTLHSSRSTSCKAATALQRPSLRRLRIQLTLHF